MIRLFQTEYEFELPAGYVDGQGNIHKNGVMRLSTAADEIFPLKDPRVTQNEAYLSVVILARVIVKLGTLTSITNNIIENLFTTDLNYLQDFYQRINQSLQPSYAFTCPHCNEEVDLPLDFFAQKQ